MKSQLGKRNATPNRPPLTGDFRSRVYARNSKGYGLLFAYANLI
jgi:hypothetical protein